MVKHEYPLNKQLFVTSGPSVKSNHADISMEESDHEEADSRICQHVHNTLKGATTVLVRTLESDVVLILVGIFHDLVHHCPGMQLWVGFGTENTSGITTSIQFTMNLGRTKLKLCRSSRLSLVLVQHPSSAVKAKRQIGRHGHLTQQPQKGLPVHA